MKTYSLFTVMIIILWGIWGFFLKLALQKIGFQSALWTAIMFTATIVLFLLFTNQLTPLKNEPIGILYAVLAGVSTALGSVLFYILLGRNPVGILIAVTALYPLVTIALSMLFLKEPLTVTKIIGVLLATAALFFFYL